MNRRCSQYVLLWTVQLGSTQGYSQHVFYNTINENNDRSMHLIPRGKGPTTPVRILPSEIGVGSAHRRAPALWAVASHLSMMSKDSFTFICNQHHEFHDCWIQGGVLYSMGVPSDNILSAVRAIARMTKFRGSYISVRSSLSHTTFASYLNHVGRVVRLRPVSFPHLGIHKSHPTHRGASTKDLVM